MIDLYQVILIHFLFCTFVVQDESIDLQQVLRQDAKTGVAGLDWDGGRGKDWMKREVNNGENVLIIQRNASFAFTLI